MISFKITEWFIITSNTYPYYVDYKMVIIKNKGYKDTLIKV